MLTIAVAVYRINVAVTVQAENELQRGLEEAGTQLEENRDTLFAHFSREARLISDLSNLKAAMDTKDPPTVEPIADDTSARSARTCWSSPTRPAACWRRPGGCACRTFRPRMRRSPARTRGPRSRVAVAAPGRASSRSSRCPASASANDAELVGTLSVGFSLDEQSARQFKALTNSEIAFVVDGEVQASTLPPRAPADRWSAWPARRACTGSRLATPTTSPSAATLDLTPTGEGAPSTGARFRPRSSCVRAPIACAS